MPRRDSVLAVVVSLAVVNAAAAQDTSAFRGPDIVAGGEGARTVGADRASLIVSVQTRARTPSEAGSLNAADNNAIRAAIAAFGVPREDITTYGYTVHAAYPEPPYRRDTGFVASNAMRIILRRAEHLALLGRLIDTALTAGATHISGVRHEARRTADAEREALAEAMADARSRAETVARAAGGTLGELLQVTLQPGITGDGDWRYAARAIPTTGAARARMIEPTTVTPGEIEVRQYVTARWRFVPGR
jgi:uncharacterized protein YggE